jgi:hypothetical protein
MSTIAATNLKNASAGSNNIVLNTDGSIGGTCLTQTCRAWVNFNGTGTVAIRAGYNVSSITDNGAGDYTVNFTSALADDSYSVLGSGQAGVPDNAVIFKIVGSSGSAPTTKTTSAVRIGIGGYASGTSYIGTDCTNVSVAIFR